MPSVFQEALVVIFNMTEQSRHLYNSSSSQRDTLASEVRCVRGGVCAPHAREGGQAEPGCSEQSGSHSADVEDANGAVTNAPAPEAMARRIASLRVTDTSP
ncbi:hypothetical protein MHYP_G00326530 [Metynnis hypsauchen]